MQRYQQPTERLLTFLYVRSCRSGANRLLPEEDEYSCKCMKSSLKSHIQKEAKYLIYYNLKKLLKLTIILSPEAPLLYAVASVELQASEYQGIFPCSVAEEIDNV